MLDTSNKIINTIIKITQDCNNVKISEAEQLLIDLKKDLFDFLKEYSHELYFNFDYEFTRFSEFVKFPDFAERNIIGIGGKFSSGKSSFLNALSDEKILPVDTTPTTSIPTFIGNGKDYTVVLNIFNNLIEIDKTDLKNLKHYNSEEIEYSFSHLLKKIFVRTEKIEYKNLVFLDTPGYSKGEAEDYSENTDKKIAKVQLNNSNYIIWLVDADNGTISKDDIDFLKSLNKEIEILIVVTKADKKQTEIDSILKYIKNEVSSKGLNIIDVLPFSARKVTLFPIENIKKYITVWNKNKIDVLFGKNFKLFFVELSDFFNTEEEELKKELNRLNRTLTLVDNNDVLEELNTLNQRVKTKLDKIKEKRKELEKLQSTFFKNIKTIGNLTNIKIPEPSELDFITKKVDFSKLLKEYKVKNNIKDSNLDLFFIKEFDFKEGVNFFKDVFYLNLHILSINFNDFKNELKRTEKINGHFMEVKDEYLKELYLTFLFAVCDEIGLTEKKIELLFKLSNGLNLKYETILKKAKTIKGDFFTEILKNFKDKEELEYLLIDMLILLNIDSDFGEKHSKLTASIFEMFNISQSKLKDIIKQSKWLLTIKTEKVKYNDYPIILRHKKLKILENFVNVDNKFLMNKFQVTQKEYTLIMGKNPSRIKGDNLPVDNVSLYDAIEYCNKKSIKEGFEPVYTITGNQSISIDRTKNGYRLPTEEEWKYAAKGGSLSKGFKYSGSNNSDEVAWYNANSGNKTHDVGTKKPNELGIYDMSGNVWEWVDTISGVLYGGAWVSSGNLIRVDSRGTYAPAYVYDFIGFRVVQSI